MQDLAAGATLAALPVILHLFMRQTPKHVMFPAIRLIRERQRRSKKRMRVKNWLLLLARMAVLALMALALARPTIYSQVPLGDQSVPTALGLVFDTSLSMKYKDKDKTRLEEAKERAREIVKKLPDSSLVFVVDSSDPGVTGLSPAAALKRIDGLTTHPVSRQLNVAMGEAYDAVAACDRPVHLVYVLTDLARTAWNPERPAEGLDKVAKLKSGKGAKMATFVIRLTPQEIRNVSVDSAELPHSVTIQGESVEVRSRIRSRGPATTRMVEFYIDGVKKGEKPVAIPASDEVNELDSQVEVSFPTPPKLKEGELHRGEIVLTGSPDPLEDDDKRYFTFKVRPPLKVLIIADRDADSEFVAAALDYDTSPSSPKSYLVKIDPVRRLQQSRQELAGGLRVHLPPQRPETERPRLGGAQRLRTQRRRPGCGSRECVRGRELQRYNPRPDPAGAARRRPRPSVPTAPSARSPTSPIRCSRVMARSSTASSPRYRSSATGRSSRRRSPSRVPARS